jgi:hypothetical protein
MRGSLMACRPPPLQGALNASTATAAAAADSKTVKTRFGSTQKSTQMTAHRPAAQPPIQNTALLTTQEPNCSSDSTNRLSHQIGNPRDYLVDPVSKNGSWGWPSDMPDNRTAYAITTASRGGGRAGRVLGRFRGCHSPSGL